MDSTRVLSGQLLYRDVFGELALSEERLVWQGAERWWNEDDQARLRRVSEFKSPTVARVQAGPPQAGHLMLEFNVPRGQPLSVWLDPAREKPAFDRLSALAFLVQLAEVLELAHSLDLFGLTLTPWTIFVRLDMSDPAFTLVPVPAPLGARLLPEDWARQEPAISLPYIAQERLRARPVTPAVDVYALGVLGYQVLEAKPLPVRADNADLIHAVVSGRFQAQLVPREEEPAFDIIEQCLARRPGRRPSAAEASTRLSAVLREALCQPCQQARERSAAGEMSAALEILQAAMRDPILERNPQLHLLHAELLEQTNPSDALPVIAACKQAAERVERLMDERQWTAPADHYFGAHLFASRADVQLTARKIYALLGKIYRQEGLPQKAVEHYNRALQVAGDDGQLLLDYASALRQADQPGAALDALLRAEKTGVTDYHLLKLEQARAMERQGMLDQAIEAYQIALRLSPEGATWTQLGKLYLPQGPDERSNAEKAFRQALKLDPNQIEAATLLAELALERDDDSAAMEALSGARLPPDLSSVSPDALARYLEMTNSLSRRMSNKLTQQRNDPSVHRLLGDMFLLRARLVDDAVDFVRYDSASDDYVRALLSYDVSLSLDPSQPEVEKKAQDIKAPLERERSELERHIQEGDTRPETYNRLALVGWRLSKIAAGYGTQPMRQVALALLRRTVEVLDLSIQQDMSQREIRRLFVSLAELVRSMEGGS